MSVYICIKPLIVHIFWEEKWDEMGDAFMYWFIFSLVLILYNHVGIYYLSNNQLKILNANKGKEEGRKGGMKGGRQADT